MSHAVERTVAWLMQYPPGKRRRKALEVFYSKGTPKPTRRMAAEVLRRTNIEIDEATKRACSKARIDGHVDRDEHHRVPGMRRSRFGSRVGNNVGVRETQRWTPPHAVGLEDRYDAMDAIDAALCDDPPSVTGIQFQQLEMRHGRLDSLAKARKKGDRKARNSSVSPNAYRRKL